MSENQIITSAEKAVKKAYGKAGIVYGLLGALATGLYLNTQRIAEGYIPGGIWNVEAWHQTWGSDGIYAALSLVGTAFFGVVTALTAPLVFKAIYDGSNTQTEFDREEKKITQTRSLFFDKNKTYTDSFAYDVILSVNVNQGPLQRKANTGNLEITAIRLDDAKDKKCEGNSRLERRVFRMQYQETPFDLRERLFAGLPKHDALKEKLRSA